MFKVWAPALAMLLAGTTASSEPCPTCLVDLTVIHPAGPMTSVTESFDAAPGVYRITVELPRGATWVWLNGETLVMPRRPPAAGGLVFKRTLHGSNALTVRLTGEPRGAARVRIEGIAPPPLASCPTWTGAAEPLFPSPIVPLTDVLTIQPLGALNPPLHTLPTHHTYWDNGTVYDSGGAPAATGLVPVVAPGAVRLVALQANATEDDFSVILRPCLEVQLYIGHVKTLSPQVAAAYHLTKRPFPGGFYALPDLPLEAGTAIGAGGGAPFGDDGRHLGPSGVDVGLIDLRRPELPFANRERYLVPPAEGLLPPDIPPADAALILRDLPPRRLHQFCPIDYFAEPIATHYRGLLGSFDGSVPRTIEPRCGEHMQDVPLTLQGAWFEDKPADGLGPGYSNAFDESRLLAFVPDHVDPTQLILSIGEGVEQPAGSSTAWQIPAGRYSFGPPHSSGFVNRPFADVIGFLTADTYCYEGVLSLSGGPPLDGVILTEVKGPELWIMRLPAAASCADAFGDDALRNSADARRYVR